MKVPPIIATAIVTALFALQGWMLHEIISLRNSVTLLEWQVNRITYENKNKTP